MSTPVPPLVPTASMPLATDSDAQFDAKAFPALASLNPFGVSLEAIAASAVSNADAALAAAIGGDLPPLTGKALQYLRVNAGETAAEFSAIPAQTTAVWEAGTDTNESLVSAAKVAAAVASQVDIPSALNATGSAPIYACRAWVNIEGSGVPTIRGSGNVSSITDLGVGKYRVNFITNMEDVNYAVIGQNGNSDSAMTSCEAGFSNNVAYCYLYTLRESNGGKTYSDQTYAHVAVFR